MNHVAGLTTTSLLLDGLHDAENQAVWSEFDRRYRPILVGFARHLGLSEADADETAQRTLAEFAEGYLAGKYQREKGRLSAWILGIARHRATDVWRMRGRRREVRGASALIDLSDDECTQLWEDEQQRAILTRALETLREQTRTSPRTMRVFQQVAIEGVAAGVVAADFEMTTEEVYRVKNRITKRLRELVAQLTQAYAEVE